MPQRTIIPVTYCRDSWAGGDGLWNMCYPLKRCFAWDKKVLMRKTECEFNKKERRKKERRKKCAGPMQKPNNVAPFIDSLSDKTGRTESNKLVQSAMKDSRLNIQPRALAWFIKAIFFNHKCENIPKV